MYLCRRPRLCCVQTHNPLLIKAAAAAQASGPKATCRSGWPCPGPLLVAEEPSEGQLHPGTAARVDSEPQPSASTGPPGYTVPAPAAARASPQPLHGSSRRRWGPRAPPLQRGCVRPGHLAGALLLRPVLAPRCHLTQDQQRQAAPHTERTQRVLSCSAPPAVKGGTSKRRTRRATSTEAAREEHEAGHKSVENLSKTRTALAEKTSKEANGSRKQLTASLVPLKQHCSQQPRHRDNLNAGRQEWQRRWGV